MLRKLSTVTPDVRFFVRRTRGFLAEPFGEQCLAPLRPSGISYPASASLLPENLKITGGQLSLVCKLDSGVFPISEFGKAILITTARTILKRPGLLTAGVILLHDIMRAPKLRSLLRIAFPNSEMGNTPASGLHTRLVPM